MTTAPPAAAPKGAQTPDAGAKPDQDKGHLSPQIDERDGKVAEGGDIAAGRQQSSGQGSGQS